MKVMMGTFQTGPLSSPTRLSKTHSSLASSFEEEDPFADLLILLDPDRDARSPLYFQLASRYANE